MNSFRIRLSGVLLLLGGIAMLGWSARKTVFVQAGGQDRVVTTFASTVGDMLRGEGLLPGPQDRVSPPESERLSNGMVITIERAVPVNIWADGKEQSLRTVDRLPANILLQGGVSLYPGDRVFLDGIPIAPDQPLSPAPSYDLRVNRAVPITLRDGHSTSTFFSSASTVGEALWEQGFPLQAADRVSPRLETPLTGPLEVTLLRARDLSITIGSRTILARLAARTIGEALAGAGVALQALGYSLPPEDAPLPADGQIKVVRVREAVTTESEPVPFGTLTQPLPDLEIDSQQIVQVGQIGLRARRIRVRYENGEEVSSQVEAEWVAADPKPRIIGYGTKIVVRTLNTPEGPIEYWRAVPAWATSFSPCHLGIPNYCSDITASGTPVYKGIAAVIRSWYNAMAGSRVYVPGYGSAVIADIGAGVSGRNWIDLGYTDEDYVSWHQNVTVYFLTPVPPPDQILWILP